MGRVLVVDDERSIREVVGRWLRGADIDCDEAQDAQEALDRMERAQAAVVLCDVRMPGHDGLWLTGELRRRYPTTAIILATAIRNVSPTNSMQSGVLAYILKPFDREMLLRAVRDGIAWHDRAVSTPPRPEDSPEHVLAWLSGLDLDGPRRGS